MRTRLTRIQSGHIAMVVVALLLPWSSVTANKGRIIYDQACAVCHGSDGMGAMPGVPDFTDPDSVLKKPEAELVRNTVQGIRSPGSAMSMPPKGGNASLSEQDIKEAVRYIRTTFAPDT